MALTKKQAEKKGFMPMKVEIDLYIDPNTNNIYYPCDECEKLFDRYIFLTDPAKVPEKVVNVLCKDHRKKWQKHSIRARVEALLLQGAKIYLNDKWEKLTKKKIKELREKHEWFPEFKIKF